jgi:hypothetical protein
MTYLCGVAVRTHQSVNMLAAVQILTLESNP